MLFAAIGALSYLSGQFGAAAYSGWALLIFVVLYAKAEAFRRRDRWLAGGIFAFASVIAWGAFIAALFTWFGWLRRSSFSSFCFAGSCSSSSCSSPRVDDDAPLRVPVHRGDRGVRRLVLRHRPAVERRQLDGVGDAVRRARLLRRRAASATRRRRSGSTSRRAADRRLAALLVAFEHVRLDPDRARVADLHRRRARLEAVELGRVRDARALRGDVALLGQVVAQPRRAHGASALGQCVQRLGAAARVRDSRRRPRRARPRQAPPSAR